jgi:hypothetical protein
VFQACRNLPTVFSAAFIPNLARLIFHQDYNGMAKPVIEYPAVSPKGRLIVCLSYRAAPNIGTRPPIVDGG